MATSSSANPTLVRRENLDIELSHRDAVLEALRARGRGKVSVRLRVAPSKPEIAFAIPARDAAKLLESAEFDQPSRKRLRPNAELADALREGFTLRGQYATAEELFDALEASRQE